MLVTTFYSAFLSDVSSHATIARTFTRRDQKKDFPVSLHFSRVARNGLGVDPHEHAGGKKRVRIKRATAGHVHGNQKDVAAKPFLFHAYRGSCSCVVELGCSFMCSCVSFLFACGGSCSCVVELGCLFM